MMKAGTGDGMKKAAPGSSVGGERRLPGVRREGLLMQELPGELLVYDLEGHKAHCLNATAWKVYQYCDEGTGVAEAIRLMDEAAGEGNGEAVLWYSIGQLQKAGLLAELAAVPVEARGVTRRTLMRRVGMAAALGLPLITSLIAPPAVMALSCLPSGEPCDSSAQCCSGICNNGVCV